ncbi:SLBB domain-containing protein [Gaoshiqia sp. Z1-71]|uniref:SLBB domain-containing protein n=1 Tax=Gaoshiqia hydrogeniformans TaxID=3290090 RepID=UPI003BF77F5F
MSRKIICLFMLVWLCGFSTFTFAQTDVSSVKVEKLSDQQIQQIMTEINSRGLTMDQAVELAKARGATQQQINQLYQRMQKMKLSADPGPAGDLQKLPSKTTELPDTTSKVDSTDQLKKNLKEVSLKNQKIFGYQLFNQENLSFEPSVNIAVPADYVLGIGDEVVIQVWGASQQTYLLQVGSNGAVNIPDLGPVNVANLNYSTAKDLLLKRLTAIYNGMAGAHPNTFADVSVSNMRSIKVNVIGEAITPGTYTLPSTASAFNALYLSGGPNENGSFRNIRVIRDNKLFAEIDVYDYLINFNTKNNISLRDQDIIYIPVYNKRVETFGAFKRQAIFELKEDENMQDLIRFSGGFNEEAASSRLLITRYTDNQYQLVDLEKDHFERFVLKNGDQIRSEKVIDRFENRVSIEGAVFRPGTYALDENMKLSQLIGKAGGLREDFYAQRGLIIRLDEQLFPTTIPFDLGDLFSGLNDPVLKREDQVVIRDIFSMGEKQTIRILGEVMFPGEYGFFRNMSLKDLVFLSGGMKEAASESYIEVARRNTKEEASTINSKMASLYQFEIDRDLKLSDDDGSFLLQAFDQVYIRKAPSYQAQKTVQVTGEVQFPGEYSISDKNERISDLINRAGGLTPYAFTGGAKLRRRIDEQYRSQLDVIQRMKEARDSTIQIDMSANYENLELKLSHILRSPGTSYDYFLKEGDQVYIPMKSEEIWVNGEIMNPMGLAWERGKNVKYYINRSGGFSADAKKNKIYVVYSNGTTDVTRSFIVKKYPQVEPGSQIVIPAKPERKTTDNTAKWLAITSALSSLAVAMAAVLR